MLNEDVHDFIALVEGYFRLYVNGGKNLLKMVQVANNNTDPDGKFCIVFNVYSLHR